MITGKLALALLLGIKAAVMGCVMIGSRRWLKVRREYVVSDKVERPIRILFFSDLHGNHRRRMNLDIWKRIDKIDGVDMAVIAGDFILNRAAEMLPHMEGIGRLARRTHVFAVNGNHDMRDYRALKRLLTEQGVHVLDSRKVSLTLNGNDVDVVGLCDYMFLKRVIGFDKADAAMMRLDPDTLNICVSHQPQIFDRYSMCSADLFLCGHTHGGQVRLPFIPVLFAPNQGIFPKYGYGWYWQDGAAMMVTKGIGTTHFPIRFWNRPEVCVIDIIGSRS
ncbi:MAG: metallophosphoesterase family protein [Defluviitaleaceae bacterium]|nr:metallophosphoesterase family protein [Defluviitaleaceae bacterium]